MRVLIFILALAALLSGCATSGGAGREPPAFVHHSPPVSVPDVDVLEITPDMEAFLDRFVRPMHHRDERLRLLATSVINDAVLGFDYRDELTLTAAEAFDRQAGNCVGFANLMVALARSSGLQARYQEVTQITDWSSQDDTVVVATHINVVIQGGREAFEVDTSGLEFRNGVYKRLMRDHEALSLYYNNLGAEALFDLDLARAYAYFVKAIEAAPSRADPWVNLGVVMGRNGQYDGAVQAYQTALALDSEQYSAMSNLYDLYLATDMLAEARELEPAINRYKRRNPYVLLRLSEDALEEARYEDALAMLDDAIAKKEEEHLFHYARARTLYLSGDVGGAEASMLRARELAPAEQLIEYSRPLGELVAGY